MRKAIKQARKGLAALLAVSMVMAVIAPHVGVIEVAASDEMVWIEYGESIRITNTSSGRITVHRHHLGGHVFVAIYNPDGTAAEFGHRGRYQFTLNAGQSMVVSMYREDRRAAFYLQPDITIEPHPYPAVRRLRVTTGSSAVIGNLSYVPISVDRIGAGRFRIERFETDDTTRLRRSWAGGDFRIGARNAVGIFVGDGRWDRDIQFEMPYCPRTVIHHGATLEDFFDTTRVDRDPLTVLLDILDDQLERMGDWLYYHIWEHFGDDEVDKVAEELMRYNPTLSFMQARYAAIETIDGWINQVIRLESRAGEVSADQLLHEMAHELMTFGLDSPWWLPDTLVGWIVDGIIDSAESALGWMANVPTVRWFFDVVLRREARSEDTAFLGELCDFCIEWAEAWGEVPWPRPIGCTCFD